MLPTPGLRPLLSLFAALPLLAQDPEAGATAAPVGRVLQPTQVVAAMKEFESSAPEHGEWVASHGAAIAWLVARCAGDGRMPAVDEKTREPAADVAATAAALLAIGSQGNTMRVGTHRATVRKVVKWLVEQQRDDGFFCDPALDGAALANALAAAALVQAYVDAEYRPYAPYATRAMQPFAAATAQQPCGEPLAAAIAALAARHLVRDGALPDPVARSSASLTANGSCREPAGSFAVVGAVPGTQELAALAIAMACRGTAAIPDADARWTALGSRVRDLPTRCGKDGELLDAAMLWCASDVAFQLGGDARAAMERIVLARIVPRIPGATRIGSITFACGPKVLRNETAETALTALALAAPWYRVGR